MTILYGGIELPAPTNEEADWIRQNIPASEVYEFAWENFIGHRRSGWASCVHADFPRQIELGRLYWPTGASRWAVGHYLVTASDLKTLRGKAYRNDAYVPLTLKISDESGTDLIETDLYMLPARPLGQIEGEEQLYLLTLCDARFYWWMTAEAIAVTGGTTTWVDLYSAISSALGVVIDYGSIDADYGKPSEALSAHYEYLPLLLDAVAINTGRVMVRGLDGSLTAQTPAAALAAQTAQSEKWDKQAGGLMRLDRMRFHDWWSLCPASVRVTFPRTDDGVLNDVPHSVSVNLSALTVPGFPVGFSGFAGRTKVFHDTACAVYESAALTNSAALTAMATQTALDWYAWRGGNQDMIYAGIVPWEPEGMADHVAWTYREGRVNTRVQRRPWNDLNESLNHWPDVEEGGGSGQITVQEADGSPSVTTDTVTFNQAQGFTVTSISGKAAVDIVSVSNVGPPGVVNLVNQCMGAGDKVFDGSIRFGSGFDGAEDAAYPAIIPSGEGAEEDIDFWVSDSNMAAIAADELNLYQGSGPTLRSRLYWTHTGGDAFHTFLESYTNSSGSVTLRMSPQSATGHTKCQLSALNGAAAAVDIYWKIENGGTGRASHTAYAVICGGTTSTAAQQSIASVGTSGQVLMSNGAGALPTMEDLATVISTGTTGIILVANGGTGADNTTQTYTPTLTGVANIASSTAYQCQYFRIGTIVHVSGKIELTPTAATTTAIGISLPIVSNLGAQEDLAGTAFSPEESGYGAAIYADATNNRAELGYVSPGTDSRDLYFTFTYQIIG